jgi:error-prone DNA polymerase
VSGLSQAGAGRIVAARAAAPFDDVDDLARRAELDRGDLKLLAGADALASLAGNRRQQVWEASALLRAPPQLLRPAPVHEPFLEFPAAPEGEEILADYARTGLTLRRHPLALLRPELAKRGLLSAQDLADLPHGRLVRYAGLVTLRQQPETARGTVFVSCEDETGVVQVIVWRRLRDRQRSELLSARLLAVRGTWQREGDVRNLLAGWLEDLSPLLGSLAAGSRDFR